MLQFLAQTPESDFISLLTSSNLEGVWLNNIKVIIDRLTVSLPLNDTKVSLNIILASLGLKDILKYFLTA